MIFTYNQEKELNLKVTFEKHLKEPCPFCKPVMTTGTVGTVGTTATIIQRKLSLYSYGDELNGIRYSKEFYKIICDNCSLTSGIQLGLDDAVKFFFEACMKRYSSIELVKEAGNDN